MESVEEKGGAAPVKRGKRRARPAPKAGAKEASAKGGAARRALIVGINDYQGTVNDLPSCINDARAVQELLAKKFSFDDVKILLDGQATEANVVRELNRLFTGVDKDSRIVFYFSGHGSTDRRGNTIEECLVLQDAYLYDDKLVEFSKKAPPGVLSVILDSCFSGGMEKQLLKSVFNPGSGVERARVKAYVRQDVKEFNEHVSDQEEVGRFIRFGGTPFVPDIQRASSIMLGHDAKAPIPAPPSDEAGQSQLNGLLLSACLETETAAASTSFTDGKSAFTYCLLDVLNRVGPNASSNFILESVQKRVRSIGLRQTPLIKEPAAPAGLGRRTFITFDEAKADTTPTNDSMSAALAAALGNSFSSGQPRGVADMDPATIIQIISALAKSSQPAPQDKGLLEILPAILPLLLKGASQPAQQDKGLFDALPLILPLIMKGANGAAPQGKGLVDLLPLILPLIKSNAAPAQDKLFGLDDAIIIPALASVISAAMSKNSAPNSKLFGIDDAILIPAIAGVISSAIRH